MALAQIQPYPLHGVEFGGVGWQRHEGDVVGHAQGVCAVPAGLVEHHHGVFVAGALTAEAIEEQAHRLG